jgi:L-cysteine desulfidase
MPVIINSGSGNQGMTVSLPVIEYAKELGVSKENLYRALVVSNLTAIHQKTAIGKLSAYCGAVSAACGSGAGITYLHGGKYEDISRTIINTIANVGGIVCDGAKPSCAAKIASAVDAAIMAHYMSAQNNVFKSGEGLVKSNVENTIKSIGRMGNQGMKGTDVEILKIMTNQ